MKLRFEIEVGEQGVMCAGTVDGEDVYDNATANLIAVGALEIARSSLLAQRWGIRHKPALVPETCAV